MRMLSRLNALSPYGKFTANCLNLCEKLQPFMVPAATATTAVAAAASAPAVGILALIAALGAAGVVVNELLLDVSQNRDNKDIKNALEEIRSRGITTSNMVALNAKELADLKSFLAERTEGADREVKPKHELLDQLLDESPELAAQLNALNSEDVIAAGKAKKLLQSTADTIEVLANDPETDQRIREVALPFVNEFRKEFKGIPVSVNHRGLS